MPIEAMSDAPELWHDGEHAYRLVNPELVSYPVERAVMANGKKVIEHSRVEFTVVTAERIPRT